MSTPDALSTFIADQRQAGLEIANEGQLRLQLATIGTFRFEEYGRALRTGGRYNAGVTDVDVLRLHEFDKELRAMAFKATGEVELAFRSQLTAAYVPEYGNYWYLVPYLMTLRRSHDKTMYARLLEKMAADYQRHDEPFMVQFRQEHNGKYAPSALQMDISTFGTISQLFDFLRSNPHKRKIVDFFGLNENILVSWLHCLVNMRNICAHHGRLWNRQLSIWPLLPRNPAHIFLRQPGTHTNTVYHALGILRYLLEALGKGESFLADTLGLLEAYPGVEPVRMGFPPAWRDEPLWLPGPLPPAPPKQRRRTPKTNRG